ncbi:MAG: hypothetical protein AAGB34_03205 [Planctomycetota bacterium]
MGPLPLEVWVVLGIASAAAVFGMLWTLTISAAFELGLIKLRRETHALREERERRLRAMRGEDVETNVTIIDEPDMPAEELSKAA